MVKLQEEFRATMAVVVAASIAVVLRTTRPLQQIGHQPGRLEPTWEPFLRDD